LSNLSVWAQDSPRFRRLRQSLKVDYADGYAQVVVPTVNGHQMAVFET